MPRQTAPSSIGLSKPLKGAYEAAKPVGMEWEEFLTLILESTDEVRFQGLLAKRTDDTEDDAIARARERYARYRTKPGQLLTGAELKQRMLIRRLQDRLAQTSASLRLAIQSPDNDMRAMRALLDEADSEIHRVKEVLPAAV